MFLDNRVAQWNADNVTSAIVNAWGDELMRPADVANLFNGTFPSRNAMVAAGKRAYCETNSYLGNNYTNTSLADACFFPTTWATAQIGVGDMRPFPNCTYDESPDGKMWYGRNFTRILDGGDLEWAPSETNEAGIVFKVSVSSHRRDYAPHTSYRTFFISYDVPLYPYAQPNGVKDAVDCGYNNIGLADVSPAAVEGFVWSWARGEPRSLPGCSAGAMTLVRGAWTAQPCASTFRALCRKGDARVPAGNNPDAWNFTRSSVAFGDAPSACAALGAGWAFDVPREGRENALVSQRALLSGMWSETAAGIWLNVSLSS